MRNSAGEMPAFSLLSCKTEREGGNAGGITLSGLRDRAFRLPKIGCAEPGEGCEKNGLLHAWQQRCQFGGRLLPMLSLDRGLRTEEIVQRFHGAANQNW